VKQYLFFLIITTFILILAGSSIYLSKRFATYLGIKNVKTLYGVFAFLTLYMIGGLIAFTNSVSTAGTVLYAMAAILMGFLLFLLLSMILTDLIRLFTSLPSSWYAYFAIALTILVSSYAVWNAFQVRLTRISVPLNGITQEVRVMHLTDIHLGHFRSEGFLTRLVEKTNAQKPDAVFITGDLFDSKAGLTPGIFEPLKGFHAPVYFIEGNHEEYSGAQYIKQKLRETGITVLENEVAQWKGMQILGLNYMKADHRARDMHGTESHTSIKSLLPTLQTEADKPLILLHHSPTGIPYALENGVDLYLAGHTHAGQVFPANYITKLVYAYDRGLYDVQGMKVFVSMGAGTFGPPMRLGTHSEITLIRFFQCRKK